MSNHEGTKGAKEGREHQRDSHGRKFFRVKLVQKNVEIWIDQAVASLGLSCEVIRPLPADEAMATRVQIKKMFLQTEGEPTWWWEHLKTPTENYFSDRCWSFISQLCPPASCFFLPLETTPGNLVYVSDPAIIQDVLGNCPAFEYAVVDRAINWLLIENHHDVLFATGDPVYTALVELKATRAK